MEAPPDLERKLQEMARRWRWERCLRALFRAMAAVTIGMVILCAGLWFLKNRDGMSFTVLVGLAFPAAALWLGTLLDLLWVQSRRPSPRQLALRADQLLGLPDHLLAWSEWPEGETRWRDTVLRELAGRLEGLDLSKAWPLGIDRRTGWMSGAAVACTLVFLVMGAQEWRKEGVRIAQLNTEAAERLALVEEVLDDWSEFVKLTDDPELQKFFTDAARLRESLAAHDAMEPMLEIGKMEERLKSMAAAIDAASMAPQAAAMAEALEAFEGMGALGAALRRGDFESAAAEAEKQAAKLGEKPEENSAIRRNAVVSEMLANSAQQAGQRGNEALSDSLNALSQAARNPSAPNRSLQSPMRSLSQQLKQEAARQNRGRAAAMGRDQLNTMRRRLQGESKESTPCLSLCQSPGNGKKAGSQAGGDPFGEETAQQQIGGQEQTRAAIGEGESEVTTLSDTTGSGVTSAPSKPVAFADYHELSQRAVNDESLPLAHRRVIRSYFERIRPTSPTNP